MTEKNKKYKAPRMGATYDERILEEMKETLAATVYAETFPEALDYEVPPQQ